MQHAKVAQSRFTRLTRAQQPSMPTPNKKLRIPQDESAATPEASTCLAEGSRQGSELASPMRAATEMAVVVEGVAGDELDELEPPPPPFWRTRLWWAKFWVVVTGIWWGVCMQLLYYQGASAPASALPNVDWYVGMMLVYVPRLWTKRDDQKYDSAQQRHLIPIALLDVLGTVGTTVGLELAGSAIFGIIMGSITVWTALFTWLLMGQQQSAARLIGIVVVVTGLAVPMSEYQPDDDDDGVSDVLLGIGLTFGGTFFYALEYTLCERIYTLYPKPLDAKQLCFWTGVWGLTITLVWICAYVLPRWETLVVGEVAAAHGVPLWIGLLYVSHTLNNSVHNLAWFYVCELEGGVTTGLLQGVKAALLFVASAACFCSDAHPEQCYTLPKLGATGTVLAGTVIYYASCPARCAPGGGAVAIPDGGRVGAAVGKRAGRTAAPVRAVSPQAELKAAERRVAEAQVALRQAILEEAACRQRMGLLDG